MSDRVGIDDVVKQAQVLAEGALEQAMAIATLAVEEVKQFLASEEGKRIRHYAATGLMMAAPAVAAMPMMRRSRLGKFVELAGGATLIATLAEKIRDWEPGGAEPGQPAGA